MCLSYTPMCIDISGIHLFDENVRMAYAKVRQMYMYITGIDFFD